MSGQEGDGSAWTQVPIQQCPGSIPVVPGQCLTLVQLWSKAWTAEAAKLTN